MVEDLRLVIRLQGLDNRIEDLRREIASLPKHISAIEKSLESHTRRLEADKAALSGNQKERRQLESDIHVHEQKISKLKDQMLSAKTNEQYSAFRNEIEYFEKQIRVVEDKILDRMTESETLEANVKRAETAMAAETREVEAEKKAARERTAAVQAQLDGLERERRELASAVSRNVLSAYERIRVKRRGLAVAEAVDGRCSACQLTVRLQFLQDIRKGDRVMFCENCGRILYYTPPPVEFDEAGPGSEPELKAAPGTQAD